MMMWLTIDDGDVLVDDDDATINNCDVMVDNDNATVPPQHATGHHTHCWPHPLLDTTPMVI